MWIEREERPSSLVGLVNQREGEVPAREVRAGETSMSDIIEMLLPSLVYVMVIVCWAAVIPDDGGRGAWPCW